MNIAKTMVKSSVTSFGGQGGGNGVLVIVPSGNFRIRILDFFITAVRRKEDRDDGAYPAILTERAVKNVKGKV